MLVSREPFIVQLSEVSIQPRNEFGALRFAQRIPPQVSGGFSSGDQIAAGRPKGPVGVEKSVYGDFICSDVPRIVKSACIAAPLGTMVIRYRNRTFLK